MQSPVVQARIALMEAGILRECGKDALGKQVYEIVPDAELTAEAKRLLNKLNAASAN